MAENFPYETRLNILHEPLEVIDEKSLSSACTYKWFNQTLCQVNESVVRLGVVEGEYHWHKHDNEDEFFYVIEGELFIDLEYRSIGGVPVRSRMDVPFVWDAGHARLIIEKAEWADDDFRGRLSGPGQRLPAFAFRHSGSSQRSGRSGRCA